AMLDKREIYRSLIDLNQDDEWVDFLKMAGKEQVFNPTGQSTGAPVYHIFYDSPLYVLIDTTGATITGSDSKTITVTGLPVGSQNVLVVGTLLKFPDGKVGRVQTVPTAAGFTATSVDGTKLTLTAGNKLSAFSNAQEEGSNGPDPMRWDMTSLANRIQIFRNSIQITDVQNMQVIELEIDGKPHILPYEMIKGQQRHRGDISLAFWMGQISETLFSDSNPALSGANGYGVQTTRGMDQYIDQYGIVDTVTTAGGVTLADITDQEAQLVAARAPREYMVVGSHGVIAAYSDFLKGLNSSGALNSVRMNVNGREVDLMVERFTHGGFTFNLRMLNVLSNTSVINYAAAGTARLDIAKSAYFLPLGKVPTLKVGGMTDYFRYRYMVPQAAPNGANSKTNGQTTEVMTGGLAPVPTSTQQVLNVTWTSNMGLEIVKPQVFMKSKVL